MKYIKFFKELNNKDVPIVGGKNASIGEMFQELVPMGIKVPNGFAITSEAYWYLLDSAGIREKIKELLDKRMPLYKKASTVTVNGNQTPKKVAEEILNKIKQH